MIRYYNSRELSNCLGYNLSRWKRWTRDFLPPDPLGGLQSGYARQYSMRESFIVALGGHLVAFLKFSVHQAGIILADLDPWLGKSGYFKWSSDILKEGAREEHQRQGHCIYIRRWGETGPDPDRFCYAVVMSPNIGRPADNSDLQQASRDSADFINTPVDMRESFLKTPFVALLCIGAFRRYFLEHIHPPK